MATPRRVSRQAPQQKRAEGLSSGGFLLAALLTCAFGVGVVVAGYFWMQAAPQASQAVLSATGRSEPAAAPAPLDEGSWTDNDMRDCRMQATTAAETANKRKLAAVSADRVGLGGPDAAMVERSTYLLCSATRKPQHLCDSYWRDWFIHAIKSQAADFRQVSASAYWTKVSVAERARRGTGANQQQWQTVSDDLDQTTREIGDMHDEITLAFRSLIADGIVDPADFAAFLGMGIPSDIAAMIGDARPLRRLCE
jgi:hypothetical protein